MIDGTSLERPIIWSHGGPAIGSRRRPVDVPVQNFWIFVSPVKKQKQICNTRTITSEKQFFHKIINFCVGPWGSLVVSLVGFTLGPLGKLQGTSLVVACQLDVSYDNLPDYNVYHPKIVANHGSFIHLKYSLTDLITQLLQENNPLFYDLWSIYHPRALSGNSKKKLILLVIFKNCKF